MKLDTACASRSWYEMERKFGMDYGRSQNGIENLKNGVKYNIQSLY